MATADQLNLSGTDAAKPTSGFIAGRLYFATDSHKLYRDSGSAWVDAGLGGGGGGLPHVVHVAQTVDNSALSSATFVAYPNLSASITIAAGSSILARVSGTMSGTGAPGWICFQWGIDGTSTAPIGLFGEAAASVSVSIAGEVRIPTPGTGAHTITLNYKSSGSYYCRPTSQTDFERLAITLEETA